MKTIYTQQNIHDWKYGNSPLSSDITNPNFWKKYLPSVEYQTINGVETFGCVSYSALNALEILYHFRTGQQINFSDRYIASLSNTTKSGNYLRTVWDTIRQYGVVREEELPFEGTTFEEYMNKEDVLPLIDKGKEFLEKWNIYYEFVPNDPKKMYEALGKAPLQATLKYANSLDNEILNPKGEPNHAVIIFDAVLGSHWKIFDHYTKVVKKYAWDYDFGAVLVPTLKLKNRLMPKIKDNTLIQLVEGKGGFGLYLDEKLYIDDLDKILASFIVRNKGNIKGKTLPVTQERWDSFKKYNLKNNEI